MTIDKFGRHIQKHIVRRHLAEEDVVTDFLEHPKFKKELEKHISNVPPPKYVIQLHSNGRIGLNHSYYIQPAASDITQIYINKLYEGKIVKVNYSNDQLVRLSIGFNTVAPTIHLKVPIGINTGLRLMYIGPHPVPAKTEPVFAEVVVEGNVIA